MTSPEIRLVERTLYPALVEYLHNIGFSVGSEVQIGKDYIDILFTTGSQAFVLEVKVAPERKQDVQFFDGIVQAYGYARKCNTTNFIVVLYPYDVRGSILGFDEITSRALERQVQAIILTESWYTRENRFNVKDILSTLKAKIDNNVQAVDNVEDAARIIREAIRALAALLNRAYTDQKQIAALAEYLSQNHDLFVAPSGRRLSAELVRKQTIDLIAYILMNQILFYFVYSKNAKGNTLPSMHKIKHPQELSEYFEEIREVDFAPIFDIDVSSKIPPTPEIIKRINDVIDVLLEALRIHRLKHDLYGRLIGRSLPTETRELLASYYTKPSPARLMAALTITEPYQTVWDAACGSGTLLVAAYDRKKMLYRAGRRSLESDEDLAKLHARFVEEDLTGTDIMAFACHLASLNLAAQNLAVSTNSSRVCRMNSLRIDKLPVEAQEAYGDTYRVLAPVSLAQKTIHEFEPKKKREVKPKTILLTKVNCVLINPPFTKLSRLPTQVKKQLGLTSRRFLGEGRMPLWVHFLHLTDRMLLDGGKLGAIVPISLFHGKDTQKLREFYFNNYRIEYVIKPASGDTFSEDSDYGDLIFIARKAKPDPTHKIKFVFFKDPGRRYSLVDIDHVVSIITTSVEHGVDTEDISMYEVEQTKLANELDNLMPYLFTSDSNLRKKLGKWVDEIRKSESMQMLSVNRVQKGYQFRPKDTARKALFIRRLSDSRVRNALQYFERVEGDKLVYFTKGGDRTQTIPLSMLTKTFRSVASVDKIEITELYDLVLRSKAKSNSRGACLFLAHRFRLNSSETFATAFYSSAPLVSTEAITMYRCEDVAAKILSLYFNSVFYLIQLMVLSKQATYGFIEMTRLDFGRVFLPRLSAISDKDTKILLELFEKLRKQKLDSIMEQLRTASNYRLEIDGAFARILNLNIGRRELPELYRNLADELSRM